METSFSRNSCPPSAPRNTRIAAQTISPSGLRKIPNRMIPARMKAIGRSTMRGTGGPSRARDLTKIASPIRARIPPSTVGKYAGPMRTAVPMA